MDNSLTLTYKILPEYNLIIDSYHGLLTLENILTTKGNQANDPLWNPSYNTLSDMRNSNILLTEKEIELLGSFQVKDDKWSKERKTASITNTANHVVFEMFFNLFKPSVSLVEVKAFSTVEAAILWLGIDFKIVPEIKSILENLAQ